MIPPTDPARASPTTSAGIDGMTIPPTDPVLASPTTPRGLGPSPGRGRSARRHRGPAHRTARRAAPRTRAASRWWSHRDRGARHPHPCAGPRSAATRPTRSRWLLTDLSDVELEAPTEEREEAVQSGGAHYAESLPVEYQPDAEYLRLFHAALAASARADRARRRRRHRAGAGRARARRRARLAGPGRHPGRHPAAPLGRGAARPHAAALRRVDRPRPRHRHGRAAPPRRAARPGRRGVRRRLDGQGRDHPRAGRGAAPAPAFDPRARRARRPRPVHADVRHPRRLPRSRPPA